MQESPQKAPVGPFIGVIIIVLILAAGGIYFAIKQAERLHQQQTYQANS